MQELRHTALEMTKSQNDSIGEVIQDNGKRLFDFIRNRVREEEEAEDADEVDEEEDDEEEEEEVEEDDEDCRFYKSAF